MKSNTRSANKPEPENTSFIREVFRWPSSSTGRWSVGLAVLFMVMMGINNLLFMQLPEEVAWRRTVLPFYGIAMLLAGFASGVLALLAIAQKKERTALVWLPLLIGLFIILLLLGELLLPH